MVSTEMTLLSSFVIWTLTSSHSSTGITSPSLYLIQNAGMSTESTYRDQLNSHQMRLEALASVTVQVMSTEDPLLAKMSGAPSIFVTGTKIEVNMCSINEWVLSCKSFLLLKALNQQLELKVSVIICFNGSYYFWVERSNTKYENFLPFNTDIIISIYFITHHFEVNESAHFLLGADLTLVIARVISGDPSGNNNSIL